jgi:hypothetical protein
MGTNYLFGKPSFFSGMSRTLDLWGLFDDYNYSLTDEQADQIALYQDWVAVSQDMQTVLGKVKNNPALLESECTA